jgi:hypothetical protein
VVVHRDIQWDSVDALDCREETYLVEHGDFSPLQQYIDLGDHLHSINSCMSDDGWRVVDQQFVELPYCCTRWLEFSDEYMRLFTMGTGGRAFGQVLGIDQSI